MGMSFTIDSKALEAKLKSLTDKKQEQIVRAALREGARVYRKAVADAAPERTDDLPSSNALPPGALKHDVIIQKKQKQLEYDVKFGSETSHVAHWVDEGHNLVKKTKSGKKVIGHVEGSGFFRKAYEVASSDAAAAVETSLNEQINKAWKK